MRKVRKIVFSLVAFLLLLTMVTPGMGFAESNTNSTNTSNNQPNIDSGKPTTESTMNLTQYVDPFIGTGVGAKDYGTGGGGANLFPGADVPFGMMQWSPDTNKQTQGGYKYEDKSIEGFSVNHLSGAGGPGYGDIPFMPIAGSVDKSPATHADDYKAKFSHDNESASPGYYQVKLDSGINTQLTVNQRSGIGKFSYASDKQATMLINTSGSSNGVDESHVKVIGDHQVEGSAKGGKFYSGEHTVYFIAKFDHAFKKHGTWKDSQVDEGSDKSDGKKSGAYVTFDKGQDVKMKVGISYVSIENAEENLDKEISDFDFQKTKKEANQAWNQRLNRIQVSGGTDDQKKIFYTALYHSLLHPNVFSDTNGEYIGFDDKVHTSKKHEQYANFSSWDIYRSEYQLLSVLAPDETSDMNQSQLNDAKQGGGAFPIWGVANDDAHVMIGDSSDIMIASGYAFGADNFDHQEALKYMIKGATDTSVHSKSGVTRYGLKQYLDKGYEEPSTTLEYVSDDFSIAQFAKSLGDTDTYKKFMKRSQNWQKLFNPETGFIQPKHENGAFVQNFDPKSNAHYMESNGYQYAWMVPHNLEGLFNAMGGKETVVKRLDRFFKKLNDGQTGTEYAFLGNEPSLEVPWEYNFAGAPWKTQKVVRRAITELYDTTPGGMAGNDDLGEMSSWYIWGAMGLYPEIPGVAGFTIGSPLFSDIKMHLKDGHLLHITAPQASEDKPYVQSLQFNGEDYQSTWLSFDQIMSENSANLDFELGDKPNKDWASGSGGLSPSFTEGQEPGIGFLSKSEISVTESGDETDFKLGIKSTTSESMKIDWKADVPDGFELSKESGTFSVDAMGSKSTDLTLKVPDDVDNGTYVIPIQFSEGSKQLTPAALQVNVKYGDVTGEIESIHADEDYPPNEVDSNLIDGNAGTKWLSHKNTAEITMKLSKPEAVAKYGLTSANDASVRDPKDWTLYGSNDGKDWTKLDSRSDVKFNSRKLRKIFRFKNEDKYTYYRLNITKNSGGGDTQLAEIDLSTQYHNIIGGVTDKVDSIHADENNPPNEIDSNLIDGNVETKWLSGKDTAVITMGLAEPEAVNKYALTSANDFPGRDPEDWTLYGSKDGDHWTELDSQSGVEFNGRHQRNIYRFDNDEEYSHYRLNITKNAGGEDTQLAEINLAVIKKGGNNPKGTNLKVMTYNLKNGVEKDYPWDDRRPIMKELLEKEKPDVMGTQEGYKFQLDDMKSDLKGYDWIGEARGKSGDDEHMALFYKKSKLKLIEHGDFWLSDTPDKKGSKFKGNVFPRMVTWARFQDKDTKQQFYMLNTHFPYQQTDTAKKNREKSADVIVQKIKDYDPELPLFLTGDFNNNANDYTKPYQILIDKGGLTDTKLVAESKVNGDFPSFNDFKYPKGDPSEGRIDWILAKGSMTIDQYKVDDFTKDGEYASDHFPVVDKIHLNDQKGYNPNFAYDNLEVSKTEIDANESLKVTASVKNNGDMGTKNVHLKVDGKNVGSKLVALAKDKSKNVTFSTKLYEGGEHQISVEGSESKTVTVHAKPAKLTYKNFQAEIGKSYRQLTAKITVKNIGSAKKEKELPFYIDDQKQKSQTVELGPGESKTVSFNHTFDKKDKTGLRWVRIGDSKAQAVMPYILGDVTDQVESVTADDEYTGNGETADKLIDGDINTKWLSHKNTAVITMKLSQPEAVNKYAFTSANDWKERDPKDWTLYGSKDGENWTKLNEQSGVSFYGQHHQRNIYKFKNDDKYTYYRFDITKNNGDSDTQLGEIDLATQNDTLENEVSDKVESVHADEDNPPRETADNLVDGDMSTKWLSGKNTADITMKLSQPEAVNQYAFTTANDFSGRDPQDWTLYGSEDGEDWTKLDSQSGIQFDKRHQTKGFQSGNDKKYTYYRIKITKNAGGSDTQLAEIALSVDKDKDQTPPEIKTKMNGKTLDPSTSIADSKTAKFTWNAKDDDSGIDQVTATFDGKTYKEGTKIDLAGLAGKHELVVTAVDKAGNTKKETYEINVTTSIDNMKELVKRYEKDGTITDQNAVRLLNLQLTTIGLFEKQGASDKVEKHLKGFKVLLEHQKNTHAIPDDVYKALKADADSLLKK